MSTNMNASGTPAGPVLIEVVLDPEISVGAGQTIVVPVLMRHWLPDPVLMTVTILGLDATWTPPPTLVGPVLPGHTTEVEVTLTAEQGALAARYPFVVAVQTSAVQTSAVQPGTNGVALNGGHRNGAGGKSGNSSSGQLGMAEAVLILDAPDRIGLAMEPQQPAAVFTKKITVSLTNPGREDRVFGITGQAANGARVKLSANEVQLPAGRTVTIKGRLWVSKPSLFGSDNTHAFSISGRGTGAPQHLEGVLRARPLLRGWLTAAIAIVLTIALWVGVALIAIPRITDSLAGDDALTAAQAELESAQAASAASESSASAASAEAASGAAGGAGGAAGDPAADPAGEANPTVTDGTRLTGAMIGSDPAGVTVLVEPVSVVQAAAAGALPAPSLFPADRAAGLSADGPIGKIFGASLRLVEPEEPVGRRATTSAEDGTWSFAGITGPGYYLVTFARPGFQTQRYIIDPALLPDADPMKVELTAGQGKLSGTVTSAGGTVGAATVTITDGTNALETSTVSTAGADLGGWEVNGLSTPGNYLITVEAAGFGTTSALVDLAAGAEEVVNLTLTPGVGSITGQVSGMDQFGVLGGLGGLTVTAVDGELTRTANTITAGAVGRFSLPDLPTPGNYTLTVSGSGYQPKTQQISLGVGAENASVNLTMTRSDGVVTGSVTDEALVGLPGVGLTLTGQDATFKTMSASSPSGTFRFSGVTPGLYVLAASQYGRQTSYATVEITAAETATADLVLAVLAEGELAKDSRIRGRAVDARTGGPLTCDRAAEPNPDCRVTVRTTTDYLEGAGPVEIVSQAGAGDDYNLPALDDLVHPGLLPGLYAVTVSAPGYEPVTINIQVAMSAIVPAPQVSLQPLGLISGTITAKEGSPNAPSCVVAVPSGAAVPSTCVVTPPADAESLPTCVADAARCAVTVKGAYEMRGFSAGGYDLRAIPTDPEYLPSDPLPVQLDRGAAIRYEPVLNRKPRVQITVLIPDDLTGELKPIKDLPITLVDAAGASVGVPIGSAVTNIDGSILFSQLAEGVYTASATVPIVAGDPASRVLTGTVVTSNVTVNQTVSATVVAIGKLGPVVGRVQTTVDGVPQALAQASVTITGIVGYSGRSPQTASAVLLTNNEGCYAVIPDGWTEPVLDAAMGCTIPITDSAAQPAGTGLVVRAVTVAVAEKPANTFPYQASGVIINAPVTAGANWTLNPITLAAQPSAFGSHTVTFDGPPITGAVAVVTSRAVGAGNVAVTVSSTGVLHWQDDQIIGQDKVVPGRYKVRIDALGYSPLLFDVFCDLGQTCITTDAGQTTASESVLRLRKLGTVAGSITVPASSNVAVNWADAVVQVVSTPSGVGAVTVRVFPTAGDTRVGTIEFRDSTFASIDPVTDTASATPSVGAGLAVSGTYTFLVKVSGFDSYPVTVTCTAGVIEADGTVSNGTCQPFAAPLTQLPVGGGSVDIKPDLDAAAEAALLPSVSLIVTKQAVATSVITATVNAQGQIVWDDSSLPDGLLQGGSYTVTATLPGYRSTSTEYTFNCSAASCTPGVITMQELPRPNATIKVTDGLPDSSPIVWSGLVTTIVSRPGTAAGVTISAQATVADPNVADLVWTDQGQPYPGIVPAGEYIVSFALPGYDTSARYKFVCSATNSSCVMSLASDATNTAINPAVIQLSRFPVLGNVTWVLDGGAAGDLPSIQVTGAPTGAGQITVTPEAAGGITWVETGSPAQVVRAGTYQLTVSATGYETQTYTLNCDGVGACPATPLELKLSKPGGLTIDFVTGSPAQAVTGATVTLSGTDIASNTVTLAEGVSEVSFSNISARNPNSYTVRVQAAGFAFEDFTAGSTATVSCENAVAGGLIIQSGGTTCTITLSPLGSLKGGVVGLTPSTLAGSPDSSEPLSQVLLTATQVDSAGTQIANTKPFVVRSEADGSFTITGTNQTAGLANNNTFFKLSAVRAGYQSIEGTVQFSATGVLSLVGTPAGLTLTGTVLTISMTVNPVDLRVQLRLGTTDVTTGITLTLLAGTTEVATCPPGGDKCAVPVTGTSTYFTFKGVTPGVYTLRVVSSNTAYRSLDTQVIVYAGQAVQSTLVSLATGSSVVTGLVTYGVDNAVAIDQTVTLVKEASPDTEFLSAKTDGNGNYTFENVLDGRYQVLVKREGFNDWRSVVFTVNSGGDPNIQVEPARLGRASRTVAVTVASRADAAATFDGATVTLAPTSATGLLAGETARTETVTGKIATFTGIPTGDWTATVTSLPAPRAFSSGLFSAAVNVPALAAGAPVTPAPGLVTILDTAKKVSATWTANACSTAPTSFSAVLTRTNPPAGSTPPTPTLPLTITGSTAESGTIYLPDGAYSAAISHSGTTGWIALTDTFNLPAAVPGDSDVPTVLWNTVPVAVSVTLGGNPASATTVLAHRTGAASTTDDVPLALTAGTGNLCLTPDVSWDISIPNLTNTFYTKSLAASQTPTRATPGTYTYTGLSLAPEESLETVQNRPGDTRTVSLALFDGATATGTALVTQSLAFAATETSQVLPTGTTVYAPAGTYTWQATPGAGDEFDANTGTTTISATTLTTAIELKYNRVVAAVTVNRSTTPPATVPQAGALAKITVGTTEIFSQTTAGAAGTTATVFDLAPGTYIVSATWTDTATPPKTWTGTVTVTPAVAASATLQTFSVTIA